MSLLIISASLSTESNSRLLALEARRALEADGTAVNFLDLRELPLPLCDGGAAYKDPNTAAARARIAAATGILCSTPVYNYDVNAALKNLIELTGKAWENKVVAFACAAGGNASYMSIMGLANSLMLDFRCVIVPRFVYAVESDFQGETITNTEVARRTQEMARALAKFSQALG